MKSFKTYLFNKYNSDIFNQNEFGFVNSKKSNIVQLADLITGTIARGFDKTVYYDESSSFIQLIEGKLLPIIQWPSDYKSFIYSPDSFDGFDQEIAEISIRCANEFLIKNAKSKDSIVRNQINCLQYLLSQFLYVNPTNYIPTYELIKNTNLGKGALQQFKTTIIAKLRDSGVLITSSSKGYKLPMNKNDLYEYINHSNSKIQPMIFRVINARNIILKATRVIDILDKPEYSNLKLHINQFGEVL